MNADAMRFEAASREDAIELIGKSLDTFDFKMPAVISIEPKDKCHDYKALIGIWSREAAADFTARSEKDEYTDKQMRELWYHKFLGYTKPSVIGRTEIGSRLRSITDLKTRGDNFHFARKIEEWCTEHGVPLSQPDSEYKNDKEMQNQ